MKETFSARVILLKRSKWERSIAREHWERGGIKLALILMMCINIQHIDCYCIKVIQVIYSLLLTFLIFLCSIRIFKANMSPSDKQVNISLFPLPKWPFSPTDILLIHVFDFLKTAFSFTTPCQNSKRRIRTFHVSQYLN